jgi:hypothetical protein
LIDIEEAKYQAQKRKEAIERAKTLQYYKTDRVKGYHVSKTKKLKKTHWEYIQKGSSMRSFPLQMRSQRVLSCVSLLISTSRNFQSM